VQEHKAPVHKDKGKKEIFSVVYPVK